MAAPISVPGTIVPVTDPDSLVAGMIRDVSKLVAGALVVHGYADGSQTSMWIGLISAVLSVAWSTWNKYRTTKFIAAASALSPTATRDEIAAEATKAAPFGILDTVAGMSDADKAALAKLLAPHLPPAV